MTELMEVDRRTPIEIALDMDENGMVSAKKLYEFLELNPKNYSHWYKSNIINNDFAIENEDYIPFVVNDECGGQATVEFKLSASFAKKLCMKSKGEKAEQARNYFIGCEQGIKIMMSMINNLQNQITEIANTKIKRIKTKPVPNNRLSERGIELQDRIKRLSNYLYNDGVKGVSIKHAISYTISEMNSKYGVNFNAYVKSYKKQFKMKEMPFRMYVIDYYDELSDLFAKTLDYIEYQYDIDKDKKADEIYLI